MRINVIAYVFFIFAANLAAVEHGVRVKVRNKSSGYISATFQEANNKNEVNDFVLLDPKGGDNFKVVHSCQTVKGFSVRILEWAYDGRSSIEKKYTFSNNIDNKECWITVENDKRDSKKKMYILKQGTKKMQIYPAYVQ